MGKAAPRALMPDQHLQQPADRSLRIPCSEEAGMGSSSHPVRRRWAWLPNPSSFASHRSATVRWFRLLLGLWIFALGLALMVRADLGLSSWDVLHDAVRHITPLTFGQAVIAVSVIVVLGSFALGVKPGPATLTNMLLVGAFTDTILLSPLLSPLPSAGVMIRTAGLIGGILAMAFGTALYIGAELGAGPRDSLMLAVAKQMRTTPGTARAGIEVSVLVIGALLGGTVGIGTVAFAILIGPLIDVAFRLLGMETRPPGAEVRLLRMRTTLRRWASRGQLGSSSSSDISRHTGGRI